MKERTRYMLYIAVMYFLVILFFYQQKHEKLNELHRNAITECRKQLDSSQNAFDKLSKNFFNEYNDYLSEVLKRSLHIKEKERLNRLRSSVLDRLYPVYKSVVLLGLRQFQIFDKNGKSFLRFSKKEVFGDDVSQKRSSVKRVNSDYMFMGGFEAGRFEEGLRYIYPLFYNGDFVGSYEWVWDQKILLKEANKIYGGFNGILVDYNTLKDRMERETIKKNFVFFDENRKYVYQKDLEKLYGKLFEKLLEAIKRDKKISERCRAGDDFSFIYKYADTKYLLTFISMKSISGEKYGYFFTIKQDRQSDNIILIYKIELLFFSVIMFLLSILIYKSHKDKIFIKTLIDSQKDIVVLTNGDKPQNVNRAFLDFFNVSSVEEFRKKHDCICDLFEDEKGFIGKTVNGQKWIKYILAHSEEEHYVVMYNKRRKENRIFLVSLNTFDDRGNYVISFRDVTELEKERRKLHIKSMTDHMTDIYNKMAFEEYLEEILSDIRIGAVKESALVMFDIDHFKNINDTYGHARGDDVIRELANLVHGSIRKSDFLARWGGDEFVIVISEIDPAKAHKAVEKIRLKIAENSFSVPVQTSCSFGITMLNAQDSVESAIQRVDELLYRAKRNGRNRTEDDFASSITPHKQ